MAKFDGNLAISAPPTRVDEAADFAEIQRLDGILARRWKGAMRVSPELTRRVVSFQANKELPRYRWFKYKEAFSAELVWRFLADSGFSNGGGRALDPFAGAGTALFACAELGMDADGVELLPVGRAIFDAHDALRKFRAADFAALEKWKAPTFWRNGKALPLNELRITAGAYPPQSKAQIESFLGALGDAPKKLRPVLFFAALCALESASYTRKDGQFLRWDNRSGRQLKQQFYKGELPKFSVALAEKISQIIRDAKGGKNLFANKKRGRARLFPGSCLDTLPTLPDESYDLIITSPPYCNRYDYTRTYALELALLGVDERALSELRQNMLTCTVENRPKELAQAQWGEPLAWTDKQPLLVEILRQLEAQRASGQLNNNAIVRMVAGYFREMACVIWECTRLLRPGGRFFMVNDNVRYGGKNISVDFILSSFAESAGLKVERILVSPQAKGNSSQQMGAHGRSPLRKCVCVWSKPQ
jgi:DNA modification methylase